MTRYALEDVAFLAEAIQKETSNTAFSFSRMNDVIHQFPERHNPTKSSKSKKKKKSGFEYDDLDDEDKRAEPMWQMKTQRQRQQDALKTPSDAETDPFIMHGRTEAAAQDAAMAKAAADKAAAEKATAAEDKCIKSDAYESVANLSEIGDEMEIEEEIERGGGDGSEKLDNRLKKGKEIEGGVGDRSEKLDDRLKRGKEIEGEETMVNQLEIYVRRVVRRTPSIPSDSYAPMDIVERLPQEEEEAMMKQFVSDASDDEYSASLPPQIMIDVVKQFFNAPHMVTIPDSFNVENADNDLEEIAEKIITPRQVSIKVRAEIDAIRPRILKLKAEEIIPLYNTVSKHSLPEILANTLACLQYSKSNREKVQVIMSHWISFLSIDERRRFFASAAKFTAFLDMSEWFGMLKYNHFDILMLVHPRRNDGLVRDLIGKLQGDGREILRQIEGWIDYEAENLISILKESNFMNPTLQTFLLPRMNNAMFLKGARLVAARFDLPIPPNLIKQHLPLNLRLAFAAYKKGEMGSRDLAVTAAEMAGNNPKL